MTIRHVIYGILLVMLTAVTALIVIIPFPILVMLFTPSFEDLWYDDDLIKRLRAVSSRGGLIRGEDVTAGLVDVLPVGLPAEQATRYLNANGFECGDKATSIADGQLACKRHAGRFPCGETWVIRLTWAPDHTIAARRATLDVVCV